MKDAMGIKAKSTIMLIMLVTIWGATFPFEKMVLSDISPFSLNFYRFLTADILLLFMFFSTIKRDLRFVWKEGMVLGALMSAGYILQTWGLSYTSPAKSGFITALYIVLIPFFSFFIEKSNLSFDVIFALFTATLGIYLSEMTANVFKPNVGDVLTIGCAVAFAFHVVLTTGITKKLKDKHIALTFFQMAFMTFVNAPLYAFNFSNDDWHVFDVITIGFIALFASLIALLIQMKYQKNVGTIPSAFIYAGEPVAAAIFSYLILRESFSSLQIVGFSLIVFSAIFTHLKSAKEKGEM